MSAAKPYTSAPVAPTVGARKPFAFYIGMDIGLGGEGSPAALVILSETPRILGWAAFYAIGKNSDWLIRVADIASQMRQRIESALSPDERFNCRVHIGVEQPPYVKNARVAFQLAYAAGFYASAVAARFPAAVELLTVTPAEGKLALSGAGNADKATQVASARLQFRLEASEHVADALGVALAVRGRILSAMLGKALED